MSVYCLGVNHRTAPVALRERVAYTPRAMDAALARVGCGQPETHLPITELVILSTCNRVELYGALRRAAEPAPWPVLEQLLASTTGVGITALAPHLYRHDGPHAVRHLCRVASGLDSMVLGESEILGQVADALKVALRQGAAGPVTSALFRTAVRAGKRARTDTGIGAHAASVSSIAVSHAAVRAMGLDGRVVAVVGAGRMGWKTAAALRARGTGDLLVVNRTREHSEELAAEWDAVAYSFEDLPRALALADIVITSTSAPHSVITAAVIKEALRVREPRPLVIVDIAVPRDVETDVRSLPDVHVIDLDDLQATAAASVEARQAVVPEVEAMVEEAVAEFARWESSVALLPVIDSIRRQAEAIRRREVGRLLDRLPGLEPDLASHIDALSQRLVHQLLRAPTESLREEAENGHAAQYAEIARRIFDLQPPPRPAPPASPD